MKRKRKKNRDLLVLEPHARAEKAGAVATSLGLCFCKLREGQQQTSNAAPGPSRGTRASQSCSAGPMMGIINHLMNPRFFLFLK